MLCLRCDPLYPPMLRSRRPVDLVEAILTPGWIRSKAVTWVTVNDPGEVDP